MKVAHALWLAMLLTFAGCYGTAVYGRAEAEHAWRRGRFNDAVSRTEALAARYFDANPEAARAVPDHLAALDARFDDGVVIVPPPGPTPDPRPPTLRDDAHPHEDATATTRPAPGAFDRDLSARLVSLDAPACLSAIRVVEHLHLKRFGPWLIAIADRPEPYTDTTDLTGHLDNAERSLLVKHAALRALRSLAARPH
jgi:hypothetical protein